MSQCNNCQQKKIGQPNHFQEPHHQRRVEQFENFNPNDFQQEQNTYTIGGGYYAPPWPAQRTAFDASLQTKFNTAGIPDFLNYSNNAPVTTTTPAPNAPNMKMNRKSVHTGRYDLFSY